MDISENPVLNVLICSIPILMMIGIAAFQGSWLRFWYLKRWHLLDRQVQSKIVHRNTNVFLAGWVLSLLLFGAAIFRPALFLASAPILIGAGIVLLVGFSIIDSISVYVKTQGSEEN